MRLAHGLHLACCAGIRCGGSWTEIFAALRETMPPVRDRVCRPGERCGVALRLGDRAARELSAPRAFAQFRRWLAEEGCYVFTIDGIWFGPSHGASAEAMDWTRPERLAHTCRLLDLLGELLPEDTGGSVSTLPGSLKTLIEPDRMESDLRAIYANLIHCAVHAAEASGRTGRPLRLALEPGPLGLFESTTETIRFLEPLVEAFPDQFGVGFDAGHFATGGGKPAGALAAFERAGILVAKIRLGAPPRQDDEMSDAAAGMLDALDWLVADPQRCQHLELNGGGREESSSFLSAEEITREYDWTLACLRERGLA